MKTKKTKRNAVAGTTLLIGEANGILYRNGRSIIDRLERVHGEFYQVLTMPDLCDRLCNRRVNVNAHDLLFDDMARAFQSGVRQVVIIGEGKSADDESCRQKITDGCMGRRMFFYQYGVDVAAYLVFTEGDGLDIRRVYDLQSEQPSNWDNETWKKAVAAE